MSLSLRSPKQTGMHPFWQARFFRLNCVSCVPFRLKRWNAKGLHIRALRTIRAHFNDTNQAACLAERAARAGWTCLCIGDENAQA